MPYTPNMSARILDGKAIAEEIRRDVSRQVEAFKAANGPIQLCTILVGADHGARLYANSQTKHCERVGIQHTLIDLPVATTDAQLKSEITRLNADPTVTGIVLNLPLPKSIDTPAAQYQIDPYKDVEGVNPSNIGLLFYDVPIIAPCTALAVMELIRRSGADPRGADAVVIGQSRIVGRPISMFLTTQLATVTACHIETRDVKAHARRADILVVAIGRPRAVNADYVKPAAVVIDVGINRVVGKGADGKEVSQTVGDVDFDSVSQVASALTPVPGGVGPVTVAMLLRNTVEAARKQLDRRI